MRRRLLPDGPCRPSLAAVWRSSLGDDRGPDSSTRARRDRARRAKITARSHLRASPRIFSSLVPERIVGRVPRLSGIVDGRRHRRTLLSSFVSRRHLLEWVSAAHAKLRPRPSFCASMSDGRWSRHRSRRRDVVWGTGGDAWRSHASCAVERLAASPGGKAFPGRSGPARDHGGRLRARCG